MFTPCESALGRMRVLKRTPILKRQTMKKIDPTGKISPLGTLIFASRWLQLPLYLGLIAAQVVYVGLFFEELFHLVEILWKPSALGDAITRMKIVGGGSKETVIMLIVLSLIDVVMISNLLIMVIVGGYETFVSRLNLQNHPDQPEWLSHVNANVLKVKLATAIVGISSIHLLKTFISVASDPNFDSNSVMWQTIIHIVFLLSAMGIAAMDRIMSHAAPIQPISKTQDSHGHD